MADFNFNIKLGVDDSEVMKSIRRLDAESKRVASGSSKQVASAPPVQQNLSRVNTADRSAAATGSARIAAANAQVQMQQAKALGLDTPSLSKIRAASVDSFKSSFKGFELLPKSQQTAVVRKFTKSFDTFFADFDRQLSKIKPTRIGTAVRDLYNREVQAVVGSKAAQAKTVPAKTLVRQAEATAAPTPRAPSAAERRASAARDIAPSTTRRKTRAKRSTEDFVPEDLVSAEAEIGGGKQYTEPYRGVTKQNARLDRYGRPVTRSTARAKGLSLDERLQAQIERGKVRRKLEPTFQKLLTPKFLSEFEDPRTAKVVNRGLKKTLMQFPTLAPEQLQTFSKTSRKVLDYNVQPGKASGYAGPKNMGVALRKDLNPTDAMQVMLHELGHIGDFRAGSVDPSIGSRVRGKLVERGAGIFGDGITGGREAKSVIGLSRNAEALRVAASGTKSGTLSLADVKKLNPGLSDMKSLKEFIQRQNAEAMKVTGLKTGPFSLTPKGRLKAQTLQEYLGRDNPIYKDAAKQRSKLAAGTSQYGTKDLYETIAESVALRTGIPLGKGSPATMAGDVTSEILKELSGLSVDELNEELDSLAAALRETVAQITGAEGQTPAATGPKATGPTGPAATGAKTTGAAATGPKATGPAATGPKTTGPTGAKTTGAKATGAKATGSTATNISSAEKNLVKALNDKSKALDRQTQLLKGIYAEFAKAERGLVSSLTSKGSTAKKLSGGIGGTGGGGGGGRGGAAGNDPFGDEENVSAYEAAAQAAAQRAADMQDIGGNVQSGDPSDLVESSGIAEAYRQYVDALIQAAAGFERENLGLVQEIAEARAQAALYNQRLANQVAALQNANPSFVAGAAEGQVLKTEGQAATGAAAQALYGPRLAEADVVAAQTRAARRRAALEAAALKGVDPSRVSTRKERLTAARGAVAGVLVPGDEAAIAAERKRQLAQVQKGVQAAVKLDPKDALNALKNIKKQLDELQTDIKDDVTITINDASATAVLQNLSKEAAVLEKKIADLQKIGKNAPQNLSTALDTPKDNTSKDIKDLTKRAKLIGSNVKDAASLSISDPTISGQALGQSEKSLRSLKKERDNLIKGAGGYNNLTKQQKVEYDALNLAIQKVTRAQKQLNFELSNPNAVKASSKLKNYRSQIVAEQTLLGKIGKEKDPALRAKQIADLESRVKAINAEVIKIDTSVDPQAQVELSRLQTELQVLESRKLTLLSGGTGGTGGTGGGGGGGGVVPGGMGRRGGGQRGDVVSRVRGLGGAAGFFGSGLLSTVRYAVPSMLLYGALGGIKDSIKEAEQLQFNLAKIESQIQATFGEDAAVVTQQFKKQIMDISLETGLAADELALLTVQLIGAFSTVGPIEGMGGTDLVNAQIESAAKIAQSTGLPLAEITDGLTAASIAFEASFKKIGDVAIALEQKSGVLAKETISFIGDIAPVATEAGFSLEEFAALAALAQQRSGRGGAALAEQFGRIIPAIYQSRQALLDIAITNDKLGTPEFITAINKSDTRGILFGIGEAFNSLNKESKDFIVNLLGGRREAAAILPALSNPQALKGLTDAAENGAGKLEERFKKVQATLTNTFQRLREQVRKLFLTLLESGLEDLLKEVAGLLGIIAKGFGLIFKAVSPVLGAFDGLPVKILAAVAAFKLLKAATRFGPGGGIAGALGGLRGNNGLFANMRANALQRQAVMGTVNASQRAQMAALFNFMSGTSGAGQYGINPRTGTMTAPGMLGGNFGRTGRQAYIDARAAGQGRLSALGAGFNQRSQNVEKLNKAGLKTPAQKASAAVGGFTTLALTGVMVAYSLIQSGVDKQNANLDKIKAFAEDANTSIADLEAKARDLREVNAGISIGARLSGFFTGARYESEAEYAQALAFAKSAFDENEQRILDILANQQSAVNFFLERISGLSGANALPNVIADEGITAGGIDINPAGNVGVGPAQQKAEEKSKQAADKARIKTGTNKGKFNVEAYIRNAYAGEGRLGDSRAFQFDQDLADAGDALRAAALERLTKISEALGFNLNNLDGDIASALGSANPTKALEEIVQDKDRKYTDAEQKQAKEVLDKIIELGENDPRVKALLEANGLLDDAAAASLKSLEQLQKDLDLGRISPESYLAGLNELRASILAKINDPKVTGNKKLLYEQLFNIDKTINGFVNEQAQKALTATLDIINLTSDPTTIAGIMQKAAAIQTAINSGLTGEDLRKAALELVQTQKEMAIAMIQNAATAEEAAEIAGRPIKIPIETRVAAIKGQLGTLVGNWSTFTKGWETAFGETADDFITFITTALSNGSLSIDQVKAMMEKRKKDLETQRALFMEMTGAKANDPTVQAYDQAISGANAIINSINTTGKLPGDTGNEVNDKKAQFSAYQQRAQAATNLNKAKANKDSVAKAMMDAQQAEKDYQKAVADGLDAQTLDELDAKRREAKQAVIDAAKAVADAVRGIAKAQAAANKDSVAQAVLDLDQANKDYAAAVAANDKEGAANAVAAQIAARAALRDNINNRAKTFAQLLKALGSQDSLDQAQYDVNIARMNMANAVGPEERMQAWMELIAAERAQREAFKRRREAMFDLAKAQTEDPVQDAQYDLTLAQQLLAEAKTNDERIAAQRQLIDAQRAMTNAMNDVRNSQFSLRQAELAAIGDDIGAAQVAAAAAREQLAQAINAGKGAAEINNLRAGVISAEKAARDAIFQGKLDEYKYLLDTDQITKTEYANYLEGLKSTLIPGTKQFRDLEVTIKNLKDDISGNLQANLPTSLMLPTLYEVRRLNQSGQFGNVSGGANGPSVGYQDNRNIQVQVVVNNGMSEGQVVDSLAKAMNVGTSGLESRRY
jgi:hypothetical protein